MNILLDKHANNLTWLFLNFSDHYLPPINDTSNNNTNHLQRSNSLIPVNDFDKGNFYSGRKASLQDGSGRRMIQLQPYEQRTTFHKEGNAEWMIIHNGNGLAHFIFHFHF